jgi:hypothetical protein
MRLVVPYTPHPSSTFPHFHDSLAASSPFQTKCPACFDKEYFTNKEMNHQIRNKEK